VAAVGTFLSWAVARGYLILGPAARVTIGLLFGTAIGVWGFRLRRRERSFGSSLMGLALVIVHVCAYAAGPTFALVPTWVAFLGAAVVSWGLAIFAHLENDEPLWCVAFGGAAVAPFVTSDRHGSVYALLAYGTLVLLSACFAISRRAWPVAWRVFYSASALFAVAGAWQVRRDDAPHFLVAFGFPFLIALAGVTPFAVPARKRGALRWLALLALFTAFVRESAGAETDVWPVAAAIFAASCICLFFADRNADVAQSSLLERARANPVLLDWIDAGAIPFVLALHAAFAVDSVATSAGLYAASAATFVIFAWRRGVGAQRDGAAFAATVMAMATVAALELEEPTGNIAAFAFVGLAALAMHVYRPSRSWLFSGLRRARRRRVTKRERAPRASHLSRGAIPVRSLRRRARCRRCAGCPRAVVARASSRHSHVDWAAAGMDVRRDTKKDHARCDVRSVGVGVRLVVHRAGDRVQRERVDAAARDVFRCCGGRLRGGRTRAAVGAVAAAWTRAGVIAAATAVYGAHAYFDFGARIVAYLVTSAFLLGIAYWYRRRGPAPNPA
jgi:hypothetical protein